MQLIGAGLPRTATLSQKLALEKLGLEPCHHMVEVLGDLARVPAWERALADPSTELPRLFAGFQATVDWPGAFFWRELIDLYPDAKVLLSVRDGDAWARSVRQTMYALFYDDTVMAHLSAARAIVDDEWRAYTAWTKRMWERSDLLPGPETTDAQMAAVMERYNAEVQATVPEDRLLVWSVGDGWEPLCDLLSLPVPEEPFPSVNDSQEFGDRIIRAALDAVQEHEADPAASTG